jgi:hypothetical protein
VRELSPRPLLIAGPGKPAGESGFCRLSGEGGPAQMNRAARH